MQLTVRKVSKLLDIPEETIYRMIECGEIPAIKVHDQYHFNRTELLEWAMTRRIHVSQELLESDEPDGVTAPPRLSDALRRGGIFHALEGGDKTTVLRAMVNLLKLPEDVDRELLFRMYLARESLASTGIGDGIAVPHVRNPVVLQVAAPMVTLCFLKTPIDFAAIDGKPVFALFSLVTPTMRSHLFILSQLAFVLRDRALLDLLRLQPSEAQILAEVERSEAASESGADGSSKKGQ
ncbi:MAG: PTS sugar transporter subunit IIA [bacterium]